MNRHYSIETRKQVRVTQSSFKIFSSAFEFREIDVSPPTSTQSEGQKISKINRENRAKFKDVHCMGTKSLPKLIDEKKKKFQWKITNT
ncbi:hypothetical protein P8452_28464 [Trifolium repens]|nr:hypothetical protein P8452_28464 [Trifolium repens]